MSDPLKLLYPLNEFYAQAGLTPPSVGAIDGEDVPEPYKRLLVHDNDMTPTLESFHGERVHLRILARRLEGDTYWRHVVLTLNGSQTPVVFGAIVINLQHFPPAARDQILEGWRPLGTSLAMHKIKHISRPLAFIRVASDCIMNDVFGLTESRVLYGRRNMLLDPNGNVMADIVEILPPVK